MKKFALLFVFTLSLSACSPEQIFELIAKSDIEQAASDSVNSAEESLGKIDQHIADKGSQYSQKNKLNSLLDDGSYGYAFRNSYDNEVSFEHSVVAILPPLESGSAFYEGWLVDPTTKDVISTGILNVDEQDGTRSLVFTSKSNLSSYSEIVITAEYDQDPKPGKHILEGVFNQVID